MNEIIIKGVPSEIKFTLKLTKKVTYKTVRFPLLSNLTRPRCRQTWNLLSLIFCFQVLDLTAIQFGSSFPVLSPLLGPSKTDTWVGISSANETHISPNLIHLVAHCISLERKNSTKKIIFWTTVLTKYVKVIHETRSQLILWNFKISRF